MYIFCSLSWSCFHWYEVHILSYKKTSSNFGKYVTKWDVDNSLQISSILTKLDMQLWKKNSFGSNCRENVNRRGVNRREKGIIVTFVSFGLHAERFGVECTEYGNTLFLYFDIFIYVLSNFTLDSRIVEYLQFHIGLPLHTCSVNFDFVKFGENWEKKY